ncbi:MAG: hypothetical protein LUF33_06465 [Clostridiales bacterium]|nr:hypothetical protein [Clostridiales bacterium]
MIIFEKDMPVEFTGSDNAGTVGEHNAFTEEFLIRNMTDSAIDYSIYLRFANDRVNTILPDSTTVSEDGTLIVWNIKKNDIFMHGYFELQLEGRQDTALIFQTKIIRLYADDSIPIEDEQYTNPNSATLKLRDDTYAMLDEIKSQQEQLEENLELINGTDLELKEDKSSKVTAITDDNSASEEYYPSAGAVVKYVNSSLNAFENTWGLEALCGDVDTLTAQISEKASQSDIDTAITNFENTWDFESLCNDVEALQVSAEKTSVKTNLSDYIILMDSNYVPLAITSTAPSGGGWAIQVAGSTKAAKAAYVYFPSSVTAVGGGAFTGCSSLSAIYFANSSSSVSVQDTTIGDTVTVEYDYVPPIDY